MDKFFNYLTLPRGGFIVDIGDEYIQIGSPPETIKDSMLMEKGVPQVFIITNKMFDWLKGISLAEIEFPIYYNFFLKKRKTIIICENNQKEKILKVLQEALFGPEKINIKNDYDSNFAKYPPPDLKKEMNYFRNNLQFNDVLDFIIFEDNKVEYKNIKIIKNGNDSFEFYKSNNLLSKVPGTINYQIQYKIGERLKEPYIPPLFGVTCLGPSHGFDPTENTSGYIIWLNHNGIMVDPPVNSTEWLEDSNVNPKLIDSIILTHCHADHDAGTFQKILREEKITIYTTKTVINSFLRKYSSLTGYKEEDLSKLFNFYEVKIGIPFFIHAARFEMFYTLHSIPTLGFKIKFEDQSFVYSSDHNNDPELHKKLLNEGIITKERYEELSSFPWDYNVIYHEAGIPPLHTPVKYLNTLPKEIQKKIVVYHIAKKDFPQETDLTLAKFGIENTFYFNATPPQFEKCYSILNVLNHADIFEGISIKKILQFLTIINIEKFKKGDQIVKKGTVGDKFYFILSGNVSIPDENLKQKKIYSTYEYFGEVSLLNNTVRAADVYADTDVVLLTIEKEKFLSFISGTQYDIILRRLSRIRSPETWNLLSTSNLFKYCTSSQKTWLESLFIPYVKTGEGYLIKKGDQIEYIFIINEGEVFVDINGKIKTLKYGDYVGKLKDIYEKIPSQYDYFHTHDVYLYAIPAKDMYIFLNKNPGILMKLDSELDY
jgi:CRP-like cAMP-binding protein/phosphoribosyl 1,2-cyclic phosphodiesterase